MLDHEKLDVYRLALEFTGWTGVLLDGPLKRCGLSAAKHLDEASQSIVNNIAEGNGKQSRADRCRFFEFARGSALECGACLDGLHARRRINVAAHEHGKNIVERIVMMLSKLVSRFRVAEPAATNRSSDSSLVPRSRPR